GRAAPGAGRAGQAHHVLRRRRHPGHGLHHVSARPVQHAVDCGPRRGATQVDAQAADSATLQAPPQRTSSGGAPRVLILFSDTGGGHRAAARALTDALKLLDPTSVIAVADPLIGQGPALVRRLASLYSPVITRSRAAWGAVYHTSNTRATFAAIRAVFGPPV